ncbi:MAG: hypothetical protein GY833_22275 [Aestuariibacter sp.]|nr:hypothetical protein [Aestuariibacter sp.]|tara:strand:+ start:16425 stop:16703 length:279 start_codon:yes stop_codon:yes gene_type:complete
MRKNLGMNLTNFGALVDVTAPTVRNWEDEESTSEPNVSQYEMLLEAQRKKGGGVSFAKHTVLFFVKLFSQLSLADKDVVLQALKDEGHKNNV